MPKLLDPIPTLGPEADKYYPADSGVDIHCPMGTPVYAPFDFFLDYSEWGHTPWGTTKNVGIDTPYTIRGILREPYKISQKTFEFFWLTHLSKIVYTTAKDKGKFFPAGTLLGWSGQGNRVPHLHFGMIHNVEQDSEDDWLDPAILIQLVRQGAWTPGTKPATDDPPPPRHWAQDSYDWLEQVARLSQKHDPEEALSWGEFATVMHRMHTNPGEIKKGGDKSMSDKMTILEVLDVGTSAVRAAEAAGGVGSEKKAFAISTIWNMVPVVMQDKELWGLVVELIVAIGNLLTKFDIFKVGAIVTMLLHIFEHWKKLNPA